MNKYLRPFLEIIMAQEDIVTASLGGYDVTKDDIDWEDDTDPAFEQ